jgi:hypothetical protein
MTAVFSPGTVQGEVVLIRSCSIFSANLFDETGRLVSIHQDEQLIRKQCAAEYPCRRSLTWCIVGRMTLVIRVDVLRSRSRRSMTRRSVVKQRLWVS